MVRLKPNNNYQAIKKRAAGAKVRAGSPRTRLTDFVLLLRPKQWTKNLLLFAGLIFSFNIFNMPLVFKSLLAFVSFCLLSGCVYIINDMIDIEEDRMHPQKRFRPLAAGNVSSGSATVLLLLLLAFYLLLAWKINMIFLVTGLTYFALTVSYSFWFKHIVIIDVFVIALGFLLRAVAGVFAINVYISPWFLFCTLLLSLFLALSKRRQESVNLQNEAGYRQVLVHYSVSYLDNLIAIVTSATIVGYSLYTFTANKSDLFMLTIPFVIYGIFRYLYLVHRKGVGENPEEVLLKDKPTIINILLWITLSVVIMYLEQKGLV